MQGKGLGVFVTRHLNYTLHDNRSDFACTCAHPTSTVFTLVTNFFHAPASLY